MGEKEGREEGEIGRGEMAEGMNGMHSVNAMHTPQFMFQYLEGISKVMIVDFDAHQVSLWSHDCTVSGVKGQSTNTLRHYTHHTHTYHIHHTHSPHHRVMVMNEISLTMTKYSSLTCTTSGFILTTEKLKVRGGEGRGGT